MQATAAIQADVTNYMKIFRPIRDSMQHLIDKGFHPSSVNDLAFRRADFAYVSRYNKIPPGNGPLPGD